MEVREIVNYYINETLHTLEVTFKADVAGETEFKLLKEVKLASTDIV
jgi:hypothetical protein